MSKQGALPKPWENPVVFSQRILKALWNQFFNNAHQTENPSLVEADQIIRTAQLNTAQDATLNEAENIIKKAQTKERTASYGDSSGYSYGGVGYALPTNNIARQESHQPVSRKQANDIVTPVISNKLFTNAETSDNQTASKPSMLGHKAIDSDLPAASEKLFTKVEVDQDQATPKPPSMPGYKVINGDLPVTSGRLFTKVEVDQDQAAPKPSMLGHKAINSDLPATSGRLFAKVEANQDQAAPKPSILRSKTTNSGTA
jgi:hypothetical protein